MKSICRTTSNKRLPYDLCPITLKQKSNLKAHIIINHHGQRPHKCNLYPKTFAQSHVLKMHKDNKHFGVTYSCETCKKAFITKSILLRHVRQVHQKLKPFGCTRCNKSYCTRTELKQHFNISHANIKTEYKCKICGKAFLRKTNYYAHINPHSGT